MVRAGAAQLGPARLTDRPESKSGSTSYSAAAFERASQPGHPPVPEDTHQIRLTPFDGVEGPDPTRPEVLADPNCSWPPRPGWPNMSLAAAVATVPQRRQYPRRVNGRAIRVVSSPSRQGQWPGSDERHPRRQYPVAPGSVAAPSASSVPHRARVSERAIRVSDIVTQCPSRPASFAAEGGARS